jgi:hypothetical protein
MHTVRAKVWLCLLGALSWAQQPDAEEVLARIDALHARFTEPSRPHDKDWVRRRLAHLYEVDQMVRGAYMKAPDAGQRKKLGARIMALDQAHTAELKELLKIHRWFTISEFGKDSDLHAWILVQHSDRDPAFQRQVLEILAGLYPQGETSGYNYANLYDRVARNAGMPQRYGTQGRCTAPGKWEPFDIEDPANLEARRASAGLSTMAEYLQLSKDRGWCP